MSTSVKFKDIITDVDKCFFHNFPGLCKGCGLCIEKCPVNTLEWSEVLGVYGTPTVRPRNREECIACGICQTVCPDAAIVIEKKLKPSKEAK